MPYALYRDLYFRDILGNLDPAETRDRLLAMADGAEPVLLCWETLKRKGEWCHRRMVAEWFAETIGLDVPEWSPEPDQPSLGI